MDHPNAIYFVVAANAWLAIMGLFFVLGVFGIGPYGGGAKESPKILNSKAFKAAVGLPALVLGVFAVVWQIQLHYGA